jgi:protein-L-isoaspartate(D-aspartate) O-methyltransferase
MKNSSSPQRQSMVERQIRARGITDERVLEAIRRVPRHRLVPPSHRPYSYADQPLPIGHGQTISQPYIVAYMTEQLGLEPSDKVLEIGTGSGYQAAVLAEIVNAVFTVEIVPPLGERAKNDLAALGYKNITVKIDDGYYGWKEHAPFDAIIVTAAAGHIPPPLIEQLKPGGRMIVPLDSGFQVQRLMMISKEPGGTVKTGYLLPVRFVSLTGGPG